MNEIGVSTYGIFSDAVTRTKGYIENVTTAHDAVTECKTTLSDTSVFMGPVQENCMQEIGTLDTDITSIVTNFESISGLIVTESENYQAGDTDASKTVTDATDKTSLTTTTANGSLEEKKKAFAGDVNDSSQFYVDPSYSNKLAHMTCFDNTTGEILKDGDKLTLKPGETRILTVKLPDYCGEIDNVYRTTAQEDSSGVITNKSDIDPDPNKVDYIRWEPGNPNRQFHKPSSDVDLKFNTYDWIITANKDGTFKASQTCEFQSHGTDSSGKEYKYSGKKAMVAIDVVVDSSGS